MNKKKILIALMVIVLMLTRKSFFAYAAECVMTVTSEGISMRELSQSEMEAMSRETMKDERMDNLSTTSSYTAYEYSESFNFSLGNTWIARADAKCIVWHYTDGKVHLYNRTITVTRLATYDASRTYGRIVNTDGSLSYTTGDRVHLYGDLDIWDYAIDFRVTPTEASFDCYEV